MSWKEESIKNPCFSYVVNLMANDLKKLASSMAKGLHSNTVGVTDLLDEGLLAIWEQIQKKGFWYTVAKREMLNVVQKETRYQNTLSKYAQLRHQKYVI